MSVREIAWGLQNGSVFASKEHSDYPKNLEFCKDMVKNAEKSLLSGMKCYVTNGRHDQFSILFMFFSPSKEMNPERYKREGSPMGCSISLHQPKYLMEKEIENNLNSIMKYAKEYQSP